MSPTLGTLVPVALAAAVLLWPRSRAGPSPGVPRPPWYRPRRRRPNTGDADVVEALELLALALRGGAGVVASLQAVARHSGGRVGTELAQVAAALAWGVEDQRAWALAPARWEPARRALALAARAGVPPAELVEQAAADRRRDRVVDAERAAERLGVRLVVPTGLVLLPAFLLTTVVPLVMALAGELLGAGLAL